MAESGKVAATEDNSTSSEPVIDWQCFSFLTAEKSELYRAIVNAFAAAKAEFTLHLRPAQVRDAVVTEEEFALDAAEIESALQQLELWGNLQSYQDNADVASLSDYYQKRLLYQLTAAGEAAHASTLTFVERLQQQAKLDARALERIADGAGQLEKLARQLRATPDEVDSVVVLTVARSICLDGDDLTSRAQSFFRWLHEQTESDRGNLESFLTYKERLIEYLQQFVSELITRGGQIAKRLNAISDSEYSQLAGIVAEEEAGLPRAGEEAEHETRINTAKRRWQQRLLGLRGWFSGSGGRSAQLEQLRATARAAIPRLLQLAGQMNDRQSGRSDRVADLTALAYRFLDCRSDAQAHRLYRAAFALSPGRHLRIDQTTIDVRDQLLIASSTRWLDAEPVEFSPQLRKTGRQPVAASNRRVADRSRQAAAAKRRLSMEAGKTDSSRETLIALGRRKLSETGQLDEDAFRLMMELIELAVTRTSHLDRSHKMDRRGLVDSANATSRDGSVRIRVEPCEMADVRPTADDKIPLPKRPTSELTLAASTTRGEFSIAARLSNDDNPESQETPVENGTANGQIRVHPGSTEEPSPDLEYAKLASLKTEAGYIMLPDMWIEVTRG